MGQGALAKGSSALRAVRGRETRRAPASTLPLGSWEAAEKGLTPVVCQIRPPPSSLLLLLPLSLLPPRLSPSSSLIPRSSEDEVTPLSTMSARAAAQVRSNSDASSSSPASGRDSTAPISASVSRASAHLNWHAIPEINTMARSAGQRAQRNPRQDEPSKAAPAPNHAPRTLAITGPPL